jgi:predicted DNA-binding ribbon-helix-helix protein
VRASSNKPELVVVVESPTSEANMRAIFADIDDAFWEALQDIAAAENCQVVDLIGEIDSRRGESGLSGAIRVYVLDYYRGVAGRARGMSST